MKKEEVKRRIKPMRGMELARGLERTRRTPEIKKQSNRPSEKTPFICFYPPPFIPTPHTPAASH
jgi:hypothetical protein